MHQQISNFLQKLQYIKEYPIKGDKMRNYMLASQKSHGRVAKLDVEMTDLKKFKVLRSFWKAKEIHNRMIYSPCAIEEFGVWEFSSNVLQI